MSFGGFGSGSTAVGSSPFGAKPGAAPGGFGGGGSLFGGGSGSSAPGLGAPQPGGTSLFGTPAQSSGGGGLFGSNQPAQQPGGSLFGGSTPAGGGSTSLFGSSTPAGTGSTSLFGGSTPAGPGSTSLFGSGSPPSGSLFGGSSASLGSTTLGSGGFGQPAAGSAPAPSLFGGNQTRSSLFSGSTGSSLFGSSTAPAQGSLFGQPSGGFGGGLAPLGQASPTPQLPHGLQSIFDAFDPNGPYCRFRHMLYNVVDPKDIPRFEKPQGTDERLWEQAVHNNPDPTRLVPAQASSFEQLHFRVGQQNARLNAHLGVLGGIERSVSDLQKKHDLSSAVKFSDYRRRHNELVQRLFRLMCKLERGLSRGLHLTEDEISQRNSLEATARQLSKPSKLADKLADLDRSVKVVIEQRSQVDDGTHADVDTFAVRSISQLLTEQYKGIYHLFNEHRKIIQNLEILSTITADPNRS
mmetsp:Transcript_14716/g.59813  ORF Transcript_14716/g.59813 Transcript_14716/m.59813 type:complete len:465 (+) Transcript_14716:422-1816(+)